MWFDNVAWWESLELPFSLATLSVMVTDLIGERSTRAFLYSGFMDNLFFAFSILLIFKSSNTMIIVFYQWALITMRMIDFFE